MNVIVFGFKGNVSEQVAKHLKHRVASIIVDSSEASINSFVNETDFSNFDYIIGLGSYSGKDADKLRIETLCNSQFRNDKANLVEIAIPHFFKETESMKLASGIGNSYCNLVSYKLLSNTTNSNLKYTFLHIPKKHNPKDAAVTIDEQLLLLE